jgi:hypothetical protein
LHNINSGYGCNRFDNTFRYDLAGGFSVKALVLMMVRRLPRVTGEPLFCVQALSGV